MPVVIPYIPEYITVHLGAPSSAAPNVTVPFSEYVKNVASSEIYPTWDASALRANILAIMSYALNRVYTEYYRSRGYDFDITSTTAYDQSYVNGRSTFSTIDEQVDDLLGSYIRRQGTVEPLAAKFCNGTTATCAGLSQWGSQSLAEQGYNSLDILRSYYGSDVEIVTNAPMQGIVSSYPGTPLRLGSTGPNVVVVQTELNRIGENYPAIPRIRPVDGIFGQQTEDAVRRFQQIFNLTADGVVGSSTWYQLVRLYVAVTRLAELQSEGQRFYRINWEYPDVLQAGDSSEKVQQLQYMLSVLRQINFEIPATAISGTYDAATADAVRAFQRFAGLQPTGIVGAVTWDAIYDAYAGVERTVFDENLSPAPLPQQTAQPLAAFASEPAARRPRHLSAAAQQTERRTVSLRTGKALGDPSAAPQMRQFPGTDLHPGQQDTAPQTSRRANPAGHPVRSLQTMLRVVSRHNDTLPCLIPDGIYGMQTMRAVNAFQQQHHLPPTGITDLITWEAIVDAYDRAQISSGPPSPLHMMWDPWQEVQPGAHSVHLYVVQGMLAALAECGFGLGAVSVTGVHDAASASAMRHLQELSGLEPSGVLDRATWQYLTGLYLGAAGRGKELLRSE